MDRFEQKEIETVEEELRYALRHVPAPDGFTERVLLRASTRPASDGSRAATASRRGVRMLLLSSRPAWLTAAAAMLLLTIGGGDLLHLRHQRVQREAAAAEAKVDLAMQLTSHALTEVELRLDRSPAGRFTQLVGTGK